MRKHARVVVIGGGMAGASVLFRLAERGITDTVLLERATLTSGSTWHAAGLLPLYSPNHARTRFIQESLNTYTRLQEEENEPLGLHRCGQLRLATTADRWDEYHRYLGLIDTNGVDARLVSPTEIQELWPLIERLDGVIGALYHPNDGYIAPADATQALIRRARNAGAEVKENIEVTAIERLTSGEWKVRTPQGDVVCEHIVSATGSYAKETGRLVGLHVPIIPVLHHYVVTESVPEIQQRRGLGLPEMPVLRDDKGQYYLREERDGLLFGPYEKYAEPFAVDGVPEGFAGQLVPLNYDIMEQQILHLNEFIPAFGRAGIISDVRGPLGCTPDNGPLVGPASGLDNYWLMEGFTGAINLGPGVAKFLVNWMLDGEPGEDMSAIDPRRYGPYTSKRYLCVKNSEAFGHNFGLLYPDEELPAGRPLKTSPAYDRLTALGGVWGAVHGWETPMWFAPAGVEQKEVYSFRRSNYFEHVRAECHSVRSRAGLLDLSHFGKYEVTGEGAARFLDGLVANRLPNPGRVALCHVLTPFGKVASEFTISQLASDHFYLVGSPRADQYNLDLLSRALPKDASVQLRQVTEQRGTWVLTGPRARDILSGLTDFDLGNDTRPWFSASVGEVAMAPDVRILRVGFAGELGYELHASLPYHRHLLEALLAAGKEHGMALFGGRALRSLRLEKTYRSFWVDIGMGETALEAGLSRFIKTDKGDFVGRDAVLAEQCAGPKHRLVPIEVERSESDAGGHEAIYTRGGQVAGRVTSGGWCQWLEKSIVLGLVDTEHAAVGTPLQVPVLGKKRAAQVIDESPYDAQNLRCIGG